MASARLVADVRCMRAEGLMPSTIARRLGYSAQYVRLVLAGKVKIVELPSTDSRTKAGKATQAKRLGEARKLREMGWRLEEIGKTVDLCPATISMGIPLDLVHLTPLELADRRRGMRLGVDHTIITQQRQRVARERRKRHEALWIAWSRPIRLDAPPPQGVGRELSGIESTHEAIASPNDSADPWRCLESSMLDEIVGNLSVADAQAMTDEQLEPLRRRLLEAGFAPSSVQRSERERLRQPVPRRGESPAATFEAMSTNFKHRKPGHRSSAGGQRSARKQGKRRRREAEVYNWKG